MSIPYVVSAFYVYVFMFLVVHMYSTDNMYTNYGLQVVSEIMLLRIM
jgi:hypothetical protein